jgi:uncharacterized protein (TIGR01777 family)
MAIILITGGTGMIGRRLTELLLAEGHQVIILTRELPVKASITTGVSYAKWDIQQQTIDADAISKADHIIHLAGAGVADKRWSIKRKKEIVDSRTQSSTLIIKALNHTPNHIQSVISASAIGWYGADTDWSRQHGFSEEATADKEFLGETCRLWEESIQPLTELGIRLVKLRTGIVLSNEAGAFVEFKKPLKAGIATILGNGKQIISWVHVEDLCRMFLYAIDHNEMEGAYNAVAPNPVTNKQLILTLAKQMKGSFYLPIYVPAFVLKLVLGEMSVEVLKSATVSSGKIEKAGFRFLYSTIGAAINQLIEK